MVSGSCARPKLPLRVGDVPLALPDRPDLDLTDRASVARIDAERMPSSGGDANCVLRIVMVMRLG